MGFLVLGEKIFKTTYYSFIFYYLWFPWIKLYSSLNLTCKYFVPIFVTLFLERKTELKSLQLQRLEKRMIADRKLCKIRKSEKLSWALGSGKPKTYFSCISEAIWFYWNLLLKQKKMFPFIYQPEYGLMLKFILFHLRPFLLLYQEP